MNDEGLPMKLNIILKGFRKQLRSVSVVLSVLGIVLLTFFLRNVSNGVSTVPLFGGAILLAVGNVLAFLTVEDQRSDVNFIFVLYVTTFFLFVMHDVRFGILQGSDITAEYTSSKITLTNDAWLLSRAYQGERYFSSASVSLIPAVVSKITGLDLMPTFQWAMRLVISVLPLALYLTVKHIFRNVRLAALSAVIFVQLYFNFNLLTFLVRQGVAEIFLVLTIFLLVKLHQAEYRSFAYALLATLAMFGLVTSHYTLNYWSIIMVVCIFVLCFVVGVLPKRLLQFIRIVNLKMQKPIIGSVFLVFFLVSTVTWIYYTNLTSFLIDIRNELYLLSPNRGITSAVTQTSWIFNNPAGPTVGFWFNLTAVLIPIGFIYVLFKVPKRARHMPWLGGALVMLGTMALWVAAGSRMLGLFFDRIYVMGAPFFTTFVALPLLVLDKKLKVLVFLFLLVNLPINMLLPSYQRYVLYCTEESVSPETGVVQRYIREPEFAASVWLDQHGNENATFYTDFVETWFYARYDISVAGAEEPPTNSTFTYFILHYYNVKHGLWQQIVSGSTMALIVEFPVDDLLNSSSVAYNNGEAAIIAKTQVEG